MRWENLKNMSARFFKLLEDDVDSELLLYFLGDSMMRRLEFQDCYQCQNTSRKSKVS